LIEEDINYIFGRRGPVQNFVILITATKTKNRRMIIKEKRAKRAGEIIHAKENFEVNESVEVRWVGIKAARVRKIVKRMLVRKI
jgi:hypothetical protein